MRDLFHGQMRAYFRVRQNQRLKIAALIPGLHRIALHPFIGSLTRDAGMSEGQQQLSAENQSRDKRSDRR